MPVETAHTSAAAAPHPLAAAVDFSRIRYAQCWEDADILLEGLDVQPGDTCLSIASAGDNTLALLARSPARVIAVDLSPAQLACLHLRIAAYRTLSHAELLELLGSRPAQPDRRADLYRRCRGRGRLPPDAAAFWDARPELIAAGIASAGRFERYFDLFRRRILPLVHPRRRVEDLLRPRSPADRRGFYDREWDTWRWRLVFRLFFSRTLMGRLGRDPAFFDHVDGPVAPRILARARHAMTRLDPAANPYMQWILTATHPTALPFSLREENFEPIRANLDRLDIRLGPVEHALDSVPPRSIHRFNLSDIFEYMPEAGAIALLSRLADSAAVGGRLLYWNMLAPRSRPDAPHPLASRLRPLTDLAARLHLADKAFFYSRVVIEEVIA